MFSASQFRQTIGSKSTIVPSDHQLEYKDGDTIRFEIPKYIGFIDPRQSFLSMKISINSPAARAYFTNSAQSIINNLRIWDLESSVQMENIENYAELVNLLNHYESNRSIDHKRELLEGKTDDGTVLAQSNWFNQYSTNENVASTYTYTDNEVQICLPLKSGILGGDKIFPFALTGGRLEIDTNAARKVVQSYPQATTKPCENKVVIGNDGVLLAAAGLIVAAKTANTVKGTNNATWVAKPANYFKGWKITSATGEVNYVVSHPAVTAGTAPDITVANWVTQPAVGSQLTMTAISNTLILETAGATVGNVNVVNSAANPFKIGQQVSINYIHDAAGSRKTVVLSTVAGVAVTVAGILDNVITFNTDYSIPADSHGGSIAAKAGHILIDTTWLDLQTLTYTMKDIELVMKQVSPPASYVNQLAKGGTQLDIYTCDVLRNNVSKDDKIAQQNIHAYNTRAKSIISLPMANRSSSLIVDNLSPVLDELQAYNYYIEGLSQPNKKVPTAIINSGYQEPIQLWELIKALGSADCKVKNIQGVQQNFAIGRALGMFGGTYDLRDAGDLSLRTEYNGVKAPTHNKLFLNYIYHVRRLVISEGSKQVIV
mgnify:FL=1|tara:strand:- start:16556 stop:18358 length:1803 start_codon:yes stop_codon:yes gene_type:complete